MYIEIYDTTDGGGSLLSASDGKSLSALRKEMYAVLDDDEVQEAVIWDSFTNPTCIIDSATADRRTADHDRRE